jgi:TonB family protein|nr:TonB family protein [Candidatus Krumholzibacteria bacterium]
MTGFRPQGPSLPSSFSTQAQDSFKRAGGKRILGATIGAILLVVLVIMLGPEYNPEEDPLAHYGAPGELVLMPQVTIKEGPDQVHRLPKSLQLPPPPARMEIEEEDISPEGTVPVPPATEAPPNDVITPVTQFNPDADLATRAQVELSMPRQSNPDLFILHQVHPEYPLEASEDDRRIPSIYVLVAVFVNPQGEVTEAMVMANTGGRLFADEVLKAVQQWKFGWRVEPGAGRWIQLPYNFNSPYFTGNQG